MTGLMRETILKKAQRIKLTTECIPNFNIIAIFFVPSILLFILIILIFEDKIIRASSTSAILAMITTFGCTIFITSKEETRRISQTNERRIGIRKSLIHEIYTIYDDFKQETHEKISGKDFTKFSLGVIQMPPCPIARPIVYEQLVREIDFMSSEEVLLVHRVYHNFLRIAEISKHLEEIRRQVVRFDENERKPIPEAWKNETRYTLGILQGVDSYLTAIVQLAIEKLCKEAGEDSTSYTQRIQEWRNK